MDDGGTVDVVYLEFIKVCDIFSYSSPGAKLERYRLEKQTVNRLENWLGSPPQRLISRPQSPSSGQ